MSHNLWVWWKAAAALQCGYFPLSLCSSFPAVFWLLPSHWAIPVLYLEVGNSSAESVCQPGNCCSLALSSSGAQGTCPHCMYIHIYHWNRRKRKLIKILNSEHHRIRKRWNKISLPFITFSCSPLINIRVLIFWFRHHFRSTCCAFANADTSHHCDCNTRQDFFYSPKHWK